MALRSTTVLNASDTSSRRIVRGSSTSSESPETRTAAGLGFGSAYSESDRVGVGRRRGLQQDAVKPGVTRRKLRRDVERKELAPARLGRARQHLAGDSGEKGVGKFDF